MADDTDSTEGDTSSAEESDLEEGTGAMKQPNLIKQLRSVLDLYPKGQILKEMIQNAEDAGAREIKILYEHRQCSNEKDLAQLEAPTHMKALKGPGLCIFNDAKFTKKDWKGIQMIQCSNKEQDRLKVGRYGLGFKSVFHMTDWLCVISGEWILFINPHESKDKVCLLKKIVNLDEKTKDVLLTLFEDIFEFKEVVHQNWSYEGTLFWFPLRQRKSKLSNKVYTKKDVIDMFEAFTSEAEMSLLFLKSVEAISLFKRVNSKVEKCFVAQIGAEFLDNVREQRELFKSMQSELGEALPSESCHNTLHISVECSGKESDDSSSYTSHEWLVVNFYKGERSMTDQLKELCADQDLAYPPYVGVAYPLLHTEPVKGHIFCFLPLPHTSENITGLPVHVNGFFALTQDRREVKWNANDEKQDKWNECLISQVIPEAYIVLVEELTLLSQQQGNLPSVVKSFYESFPDCTKVVSRWECLLEPFYNMLFQKEVFFSKIRGGTWLQRKDIVLALYDADIECDVRETVSKAYIDCQQNIVHVPSHVARRVGTVSKVSPKGLCLLLKKSDLYKNYSINEQIQLLKYALRSSSYKNLKGLCLIPVADGSFQRFFKTEIFFCPTKVHLFPGLEKNIVCDNLDDFVIQHFVSMSQKGYTNLREMTTDTFVGLVRTCFRKHFHFPDNVPLILHKSSPTLGEQWLRDIWSYAKELDVDMQTSLGDLPLVPEYNEDKIIMHPLTTHFIVESISGFDTLPKEISRCMQELGVVVLRHVPDYILSFLPLGTVIQFPSPQGVIKILAGDISQQSIEQFNSISEDAWKETFVDFVMSWKQILPAAKKTLRHLKLFRSTLSSKRNLSISDLNKIAPEEMISVPYPCEYLSGQCIRSRDLAIQLGAQVVTINVLICKVLDIMCSHNTKPYNEGDIQEFMKFILDKGSLYISDTNVKHRAMQVNFLPSRQNGKLQKVRDLFDPRSSFLQYLFYGEDKFPSEDFCKLKRLSVLQELGLKNDQNVSLEDLCRSASVTENLLNEDHKPEKIREKGKAILKYLDAYDSMDDRLTSWQWMPVMTSMPSTYPNNLHFAGTSHCFVGKPKELYRLDDLPLIGSVRQVTSETLSLKIGTLVQSPSEDIVLEHLKNVIDSYTADEHQNYMAQIREIYRYLNKHYLSTKGKIKLATMNVVWAGDVVEFVQAGKVWIKHAQSDIVLSPYRYALPTFLKCFEKLFQAIGASEKQTSTVLINVLHEIQQEHEMLPTKIAVTNDLSLVMNVLDVLKKDTSIDKKEILIPVYNFEERLILKSVKDCTFCEGYDSTYEEEDCDTEDIHVAKLSSDLARDLGVRISKNKLMIATEEIDMNYGQSEPLTRRLRNLLHEYTDGFSVPKEIIQNADDAGASEVNFLYDERDNFDARTKLLNKGMASLQGPALWAQNDAQFSKDDFRNITKLSGETKMDDSTKIGRFGLGFNSVYNLTDVPSFISGNTIVIFDPHESYFGSPGMKANLRIQQNKHMLHKTKDQFKPFEGVFGCHVVSSCGEAEYTGTLFRFPLRTEEQAKESKISCLCYSPTEMKHFLHVFVAGAGNLLLFCQNVKTVRVYHLPKDKSDPSEAIPLFEVKKAVEHINTHQSASVLELFKDVWENNRREKDIGTNDVFYENIKITLSICDAAENICSITPRFSEVNWIVSWVLGSKESAHMIESNRMKGLLPVAASAVPLCKTKGQTSLLQLTDCPEGFYQEGHLFCFLPLPIMIPLALHINGAFALTSDRKQLCSKTEDEKNISVEVKWNELLLQDAVTSALIRVLEGLKSIDDVDADHFYKLWPRCDMLNGPHFKRFYELVVNENPAVLLYNKMWTSFQNTVILDPQLRYTDYVGQIAFLAFEHFYLGQMMVFDMPKYIMESFTAAGLYNQLILHTLSMDTFYQDFFFPNINDSYWNKENRDILVIFALQHGNSNIKHVLKKTPCIPTRPSGTLKLPEDLVHPHGKTAYLFHDSDEVFPLAVEYGSNHTGFCSEDVLVELICLGMQNKDLKWNVVHERVQSIKTLKHGKGHEETLGRCKNILSYLVEKQPQKKNTSRFQNCPDTIKCKIQQESFLPLLQKPQYWPTLWAINDNKDTLGTPTSMYFEECKLIAGSKILILDATWLELNFNRPVLDWLGVRTKRDIPVSDVTEHLLTTSKTQMDTLTTAQYHKLTDICSAIYTYLNQVCSSENQNEEKTIQNMLHNKPVILHDKTFVSAEHFAFNLNYVLEPYLYKIDINFGKRYRQFLQIIGVRNVFQVKNAVNIMKKIAETCGRSALSDEQLHCYSQAACLLVDLMKGNKSTSVKCELESLYLPNNRGILHPVSELCLDDCKWINEKTSMKFLHTTMPVKVAKAFGIKTKRQEYIQSHVIPFKVQSFGQHEPLTKRLKRILEGYPCDSSLMKELLQNADDAGASELMFIKDFRTHSTERIFDDRWKPLQGPALCVYNNSYFRQKDLTGIQELGTGSKQEDHLKTGQYGVGFNAVYHLTDVPTFLTVGPETEETLCVLDPNCLYTPTAEPNVPGARFNDTLELRTSYSDVFSSFLDKHIQLHPQGTLFRFPLRTAEMASVSSISKQEVSKETVEKMLDSFKTDVAESLLFLHNVRKITVAFINEKGDIENEYVVEASVSDEDKQKQHTFYSNLNKEVNMAKADKKGLRSFKQEQISMRLKIKGSNKDKEEEWLVVHQFGFSTNCAIPKEIEYSWIKGDIKLLPRGGVAARLDESVACCNKKAFCMLPLPIETGLPVHINGHFALDHEARRNIWHDNNSIQSLWNKQMVNALIIPAYLAALNCMQAMSLNMQSLERIHMFINKYNTLFPDSAKSKDAFWKSLVFAFYTHVIHDCLNLFPVISNDSNTCGVQWVAVHVHMGFPGYFNNLESYFDHDSRNNSHETMLSGLISRLHTMTKGLGDVNHKKAEKLADLLKIIGMKIIEAPMWIFKSFLSADLGDYVQCINPTNTIAFLQSCTSNKDTVRCFVGKMPQKVDCSLFHDTKSVRFLLKFCMKDENFESSISGLPLCLTNSGQLNVFSTKNPILVTEFTDLIIGSPDKCLHKDIAQLFVKFTRCAALKQMNIQDLSLLLGETLDPAEFKSGHPVEWNHNQMHHPTKVWINKLWKFLYTQLQKEIKEGKLCIKSFGKLKQWNLLPCTVIREEKDKRNTMHIDQLHAIEKAGCVVNLQNGANRKLETALKTLGLPYFNSISLDYDVATFVSSLTANIEDACNMLVALSSHAYGNIEVTVDNGRTLLEYFSNNLEDFKHEKRSQNMLRKLPFFALLTNSTMSLSSSSNPVFIKYQYPHIPRKGIDVWCLNSKIDIFKFESTLKTIYSFMHITEISEEGFYAKHLLPYFMFLPREAQVVHLKHMKDNLVTNKHITQDQHDLIQALKTLPFIEMASGTLSKANAFFSNREIVFKKMYPPEAFPPVPYDEEDWHDFLVFAGMTKEVSVDLFIHFAKELETLARSGISDEVKEKSKILVKHLFNRPNLLQEDLLPRIANVKFILPYNIKEQHEDGQVLNFIHNQFGHASQLIAFSGSVSSEHCYLVWSSCSVFPEVKHNFNKQGILQQLEIQNIPQKNVVISHMKNISSDLDKMKISDMKENQSCLLKVMHSWYSYFAKTVVTEQDGNSLQEHAIIYLPDSHIMVKANQIVIDLHKNDVIRGYLFQPPVYFGQFYSIFENLGVKKNVSANHYAEVLSKMYLVLKENKLNVNELRLVQNAVRMLFICLTDENYVSDISISTLYLPSSLHTLVSATDLVLSNNNKLQDRVKELGLTYFIGFKELELNVTDAVNKLKYLPEQYRPKILTLLVQEHITHECQEHAYTGNYVRTYNSIINSPPFVSGIIRLVNHQLIMHNHKPLSEEKARKIEDTIQNLKLQEVEDLKTHLEYLGSPVPDSESTKVCFMESVGHTDKSIFNIYLDKNACQSKLTICHEISLMIDRMLKGQLGSAATYVKTILEKDGEDIHSYLDDNDITASHFRYDQSIRSTFPAPGSFIPEEFHWMLSNNFDVLYENEYVGLEVYDPLVDETEKKVKESPNAQYIYAIVKAITKQHTSPMMMKYRVEVGNGRFNELSGTKLYKLCREKSQTEQETVASSATELELVASKETPSSSHANEKLNLNKILKEIRQILKEAWTSMDDKERKRVIKRLYLRWHPDKNDACNKDICTKVCQYIQLYMSKLEKGENIDDIDERHSSQSPTNDYSWFFDFMDRRSSSHRSHYNNYRAHRSGSTYRTRNMNSSGSSSSYFHTTTGFHSGQSFSHGHEAKRWFQQAEKDMEAAKKTLSNPSYDAFNWICFQCQQASEKALKALLYQFDLDVADQTTSHNLRLIAEKLGHRSSPNLLNLVQELEDLGCSYYSTRYPDRLSFPRIPFNMYSRQTASQAYHISENIVEYVRRHMN